MVELIRSNLGSNTRRMIPRITLATRRDETDSATEEANLSKVCSAMQQSGAMHKVDPSYSQETGKRDGKMRNLSDT